MKGLLVVRLSTARVFGVQGSLDIKVALVFGFLEGAEGLFLFGLLGKSTTKVTGYRQVDRQRKVFWIYSFSSCRRTKEKGEAYQ